MRPSREFGAMACLVGASTTRTVGPSAPDTIEFQRTNRIIGADLRGDRNG